MTDDLEQLAARRARGEMVCLRCGGLSSSRYCYTCSHSTITGMARQDRIQELAARHQEVAVQFADGSSESYGTCEECRTPWPCDAALFAAALAYEQAAHWEDNQRLYERAVEATREMLDEANARAERAEQQLAAEQAKLQTLQQAYDDYVIGTRESLGKLLAQYQIAPESCTQAPSDNTAFISIDKRLATEQAARAKAEAQLAGAQESAKIIGAVLDDCPELLAKYTERLAAHFRTALADEETEDGR